MQDNHAELLLTTEALAEPGAGRVEANIILRFSVGVAKYIRESAYLPMWGACITVLLINLHADQSPIYD